MDLTDEQREISEPLIPAPARRADGEGRPWRGPGDVLNGVLRVPRAGAPRRDPPERYPPHQTRHRRFRRWNGEGVAEEVLRALAEDLKGRGGLDLSECFVDAAFVGAKKGGRRVGKTERGKGAKLVALADASGLPPSACSASASPREVTPVGEALGGGFVSEKPGRPIGDRAHGSDPLDAELREEGVGTIAPRRGNGKKPKTQDGRKLGRHGRRWKIERPFAWPRNFRRPVVRCERRAENHPGFVRLGCIVIPPRSL